MLIRGVDLTEPMSVLSNQCHCLAKTGLTFALLAILSSCAGNKSKSQAPDLINIDRRATTLSNQDEIEYQQAKAALETNDHKRAKSLLARLSKKHPSNALIQNNLALSYYNLNEIDAAKKQASIANKLRPNNPKTLNLLGLIAVKSNEFKQAESFYESALKADKNYAFAHFNLALLCDIYYQDVNRAYKHYTQYLDSVGGADEEVKNWVDQLQYSLTQ